MPNGNINPNELERLRQALQVAATENTTKESEIKELVATIEEMGRELDNLQKAPWSATSFVRIFDAEKRYVEVTGGTIVCALSKSALTEEPIELDRLQPGQRVYVAKGSYLVHASPDPEFEETGEIGTFESVLGNCIVAKCKDAQVVLRLAANMSREGLKQGDPILVHGGFALKRLDLKRLEEMVLKSNRPKKDFSMARGLDEEIQKIREYLINPFLDLEAARDFQLNVATRDDFITCGIFHGPPGCGKTLLGEATATELERALQKIHGDQFKVGFILVRGTELLHGLLGRTEEMMRELLLKKTAEFDLTLILWDEMGAMFPPRGMHSNAPWIASHVAQFNSLIGSFRAEKRRAILIAADNRVGDIDPAVIRDGRFDFRLYIPRPGIEGAEQILEFYLPAGLPLHYTVKPKDGQVYAEAIRTNLIAPLVDKMFDPDSEDNHLIEVSYLGGKEILGFKDLLVSGAVLESIIERAKIIAFNDWIKRRIPEEKGVRLEHLMTAYEEKLIGTQHLPEAEKGLNDWLETEGIDTKNARIRTLNKDKKRDIGFGK